MVNGGIAQLAEHELCKLGVTGSSPVASTRLRPERSEGAKPATAKVRERSERDGAGPEALRSEPHPGEPDRFSGQVAGQPGGLPYEAQGEAAARSRAYSSVG